MFHRRHKHRCFGILRSEPTSPEQALEFRPVGKSPSHARVAARRLRTRFVASPDNRDRPCVFVSQEYFFETPFSGRNQMPAKWRTCPCPDISPGLPSSLPRAALQSLSRGPLFPRNKERPRFCRPPLDRRSRATPPSRSGAASRVSACSPARRVLFGCESSRGRAHARTRVL